MVSESFENRGYTTLLGERIMATSHITALETKHANLEAKLHDELNRPAPDDVAVHALKKQKLRIKEELAQYSPA